MSKQKITTKALKDRLYYKKVFKVGYCDLSYLLHFQSPDYYTCGVYGWNYDCYIIGEYAINTGYRGMFGTVTNCYNLSREYNEKAWEIIKDWSIPYEEQEKQVNALLMEYLHKLETLTD